MSSQIRFSLCEKRARAPALRPAHAPAAAATRLLLWRGKRAPRQALPRPPMAAVPPPPRRRAHSCVVCDFPIAVYGRLTPCLHAFCAECATTLPVCYLCNAQVARVERMSAAWVSPITMQAFDCE